MYPADQLLSFHVYRVGCLLGDDKIIKAHDKVTVMYHLKMTRTDARWHFALHADGPNGSIVCRVSSGYVGPPTIDDQVVSPGLMFVNIIAERQLIQIEGRQGAPEGTRWFRGPDDREYQWKSTTHLWKNEMKCLDTEGEIVATYRATALAISKDGELRIYPSGRFMIDLLVATSLAMRTPNN